MILVRHHQHTTTREGYYCKFYQVEQTQHQGDLCTHIDQPNLQKQQGLGLEKYVNFERFLKGNIMINNNYLF